VFKNAFQRNVFANMILFCPLILVLRFSSFFCSWLYSGYKTAGIYQNDNSVFFLSPALILALIVAILRALFVAILRALFVALLPALLVALLLDLKHMSENAIEKPSKRH